MLPLKDGTNGETEPVDLEAVVVRREELNGSGGVPRYEFALYFTGVEDAARKQLERYFQN